MRRVDITARSLAEAAALAALSDIAAAVDDWDSVRIVGGQMVHIHTLLAGVMPRMRRTVDTDVVGTVAVIGSGNLGHRLLGASGRGYDRRDGSRIARPRPSGHDAVIDLMVPSRTSGVRHNGSGIGPTSSICSNVRSRPASTCRRRRPATWTTRRPPRTCTGRSSPDGPRRRLAGVWCARWCRTTRAQIHSRTCDTAPIDTANAI